MNCRSYIFFIIFFSISSCSSITEFANSKLISSGAVKTLNNQDYVNLIKDGNNFLLGYLTVSLDSKNITENCAIRINSSGGNSQVLDKTGAFILPTKENNNKIYGIRCAKRNGSPSLNYLFTENFFQIDGSNSYLGETEINFITNKIEDPNSEYKNVGPWIESIKQSSNEKLKKELEDMFKIPTSKKLIIAFR